MTRIGPSITIHGDLTSDEDVLIEGRLRGHIHLRDAGLSIGERAEIDADIRAGTVVVHGEVRGGISASRRIQLTASAAVTGSLSADRVVLADGARFSGLIDMGRRTIAARLAQFRTGSSAQPPA